MSENEPDSPIQYVQRGVRSLWNTVLTIYYANSVAWRVLKAGALFFLGFFVWAGSNILRSYFHDVWFLRYTLSYGFVLILYGPFHHLVVIPVYQRFRRKGRHLALSRHVHLPNVSLAVFLSIVLILGTAPLGPMTIDFQSSLEDSGADITPDLACVKHTDSNGTTTVHCHLTSSEGVERVVVESGDATLVVDDSAPFEFTLDAADLQAVTGSKRFRVNLLAADGTLVRRYTRSLVMIEEG